jgi:hypothetical protein
MLVRTGNINLNICLIEASTASRMQPPHLRLFLTNVVGILLTLLLFASSAQRLKTLMEPSGVGIIFTEIETRPEFPISQGQPWVELAIIVLALTLNITTVAQLIST